MTRGRKRKPYVVKQAEGNRGRRPLEPGIEPPPTVFAPPFELNEAAKQEWDRLLGECYWLRSTEAYAIADRCRCVARLADCEADIQKRGHVVKTRNGKVKNPSIQIGREYRAAIQRYDSELGLTTASRQRLHGSSSATDQVDGLESKLCG